MLLRILSTLVLLAASASGQAPPVKTRILALALDREIEGAFFLSDGKPRPFSANRSGLGDPFDYSGESRFVLRAKAEEFAAKPPLPPPLGSVALPAASKLVLLVAGSAPDDKIRLSAYDVSADGFRAGDYRVFNFSNKSVSLMLGASKFALKPGQDETVSNSILREKALDVAIQIAEIKDGVAKRVYSSAWGHQPTKRNFVFLFNGSHPTRPIAIRRFADYTD